MAAMGGEQQIVAGCERTVLALALDAEPGGSPDEEDPFVGVLVVPLAFGCRLPGRDDALDASTRLPAKRLHDLVASSRRREPAEQASGHDHRRSMRSDALAGDLEFAGVLQRGIV